MKSYLTCILFLCIAHTIHPAWLTNVPNTLPQPDGTTIDVFYSGDEYHSWAHDKDQYTMLRDDKTGYVCWAVAENGDLISTGKPVHLHTPKSLNLTPRENISPERYKQQRQLIDTIDEDNPTRLPTTGTINEIVVFIRFSDDSHFTQPLSYYDDMFNATGTDVNSMKQYFWDCSYHQLTVNSPFYPTQTGSTIVSYQDTHPRSYFQPYNAVTNPNGYGMGSRWDREQELLARAVQHIAGQVSPSLNIDTDNDGYVDNVNFIIRGVEGDWASLLWGHRSQLLMVVAMINGKEVCDYNFNIENQLDQTGVGVLAHEFTHSLGAPDYYRYSYDENPVGQWDIMGVNSSSPRSMSAFTKWHYMGWVSTIPQVSESAYYTLFPNTTHQNEHALKVPSPYTTTEYFIVEYRSNATGLIDSALPGSGLVVWRVNTLAGPGNADGPPDELYVYRLNGSLGIDGLINTAFFSAQVGRTAISDYTNPHSFLSDGQSGGLNISDIGEAGESITFFVNVDNQQSFLTITPASFNFGWVHVNQISPSQSFSVTNISDNAVEISNISVIGVNMADFAVNASDLPWSLAPAEVQSFSVTFSPTTTGEKAAYISIATTTGLTEYVSITGTGYSTGLPIPYTQNFNSAYVLSNIDWGGSLSRYSGIFAGSGVNGSNALIMNVWATIPTQNAFSPLLNAITPETKLSFAYKIVDYPWNTNETSTILAPDDVVNIEVSTTGYEGEYYTIYQIASDYHTPSTNFTTLQLPLSTFSSQNIVVQFRVVRAEGNWVFILDDVDISNSNSEQNETICPTTAELHGNYPNPFNPETVISFSVAQEEIVAIDVYNVKGQKVRSLVKGVYATGVHNVVWNGRDDLGRQVGSGVYFYTMKAGEYSAVRKMLLLK